MADWRFILADKAGVSLGELRADNKTTGLEVDAQTTATCRIHETDPLFTSVQAGTTRLKVYDSTDAMRFFGVVIAMSEDGDGQTSHLTLNAVDMTWFLSKFFGDRVDNGAGVIRNVSAGKTVQQYVLGMISDCFPAGVTSPIAMGSFTGFPKSSVTYDFKNGLEVLQELSVANVDGSYEWAWTYTEPGGPGAQPVCTLNLVSALGTDKSASLFLEYGTGKNNVATFKRGRSVENQANHVFGIGANIGAGLVASTHNTTLGPESAYGYTVFDVVRFPDAMDWAHVNTKVSAEIKARSGTQETIELTSTTLGAPVYGTDYVVGDTVWVRVVTKAGTRVDSAQRITAVSISIDGNGNEIPTYRLQAVATKKHHLRLDPRQRQSDDIASLRRRVRELESGSNALLTTPVAIAPAGGGAVAPTFPGQILMDDAGHMYGRDSAGALHTIF